MLFPIARGLRFLCALVTIGSLLYLVGGLAMVVGLLDEPSEPSGGEILAAGGVGFLVAGAIGSAAYSYLTRHASYNEAEGGWWAGNAKTPRSEGPVRYPCVQCGHGSQDDDEAMEQTECAHGAMN